MQVEEERRLTLGALRITIVRRKSDYMVYLDGRQTEWQASPDPLIAIGALVVAAAADPAPEHYEWLLRWHLPGEAEGRRVSRMLGIPSSTTPSKVWDMVRLANPGALLDEISNLTVKDEQAEGE